MGLGSAHETVTTNANYIPEIWSREIIRYREKKLVLAKLVRRYDSDVMKFGDTIHIPVKSTEAARAKTANTEVTFDATTEDKVDISINKHYYKAHMIEDITAAQSIVDEIDLARQEIGYALGLQIDSSIAALAASLDNNVGQAGSPVGDDEILAAILTIDEADAPEDNRSMIVKPAVWGNLMKIDKFVRADALGSTYSNSPIRSYIIGEIYGMPVYKTTNVYSADVNGVTTNYNMIFHKDAFCLAMQKTPKIETQREATFIGTSVVGSTIYGVGELRDAHATCILS